MAEQRDGATGGKGMKRRGILAAAGAVVAGAFAAHAAHRIDAAPITGGTDGGALIIGGGGGGCACSPNTTVWGTSLISSNGGFPAFVGSNTGSGGAGLYGTSASGYGVVGYTTGGSASLSGISTNANIPAFAGGNSTAGGLAASFSGTVYVNGPFVVQDPANKHGAIKHPDGSYRLLYSVESPESWLEDFGTGQLANGKAEVKLDADFAAVVHSEQYMVFLTDAGALGHLAVGAQTPAGFTVTADKAGTSGRFYWRVVAKPKTEQKAERLAKFTPPNVRLPDPATLAPPAPPSKTP